MDDQTPSSVGRSMSPDEEPDLIQSPRTKRAKETGKASPDEVSKPKDEGLPTPHVPPPVAAVAVPATVSFLEDLVDADGNKKGDTVWFWMADNRVLGRERLEAHTAFLGRLQTNGSWTGTRIEPITQGCYGIQMMRYSTEPKIGCFTKRD